MDFFGDLKGIVVEHLTDLGVLFSSADPVDQLILLALNHEMKTVAPRPRRTHSSPDFDSKLAALDQPKQTAAASIRRKFEEGDDVGGHLSGASVNPSRTDGLLADWGIHHLHISITKRNPANRFYERTGPVMFAWIRDDDAYFIDIYPHGIAFPEAWTRQELLKIVDRNWPHLIDPYRLNGVVGLSMNCSDLDRKDLRKVNINSAVPLDSSFIIGPGGGLAGSGVPVRNVMRLNQTVREVKKLEKLAVRFEMAWKAAISERTGEAECDLAFELCSFGSAGWGIIERKTRIAVHWPAGAER